MPAKNPPQRRSGQTDDQYLGEYKSYLREVSPGFSDDILDELAREEISMSNPVVAKTSAVAPALSQMRPAQTRVTPQDIRSRYKLPKNTAEAFKGIVSQVPQPVIEDPLDAAQQIEGNSALDNLLATAQDGATPTASRETSTVIPRLQDNTRVVSPTGPAPTQYEINAINDIASGIEERNKDIYSRAADVYLPKGTKAQRQAYAQTLRENESKRQNYDATIGANMISDAGFFSRVKLDGIKKENRGQLVASKYGGDADNINQHLREYVETPDFKRDALKYSRGIGDLDRGARQALDIYADRLAGAPSRTQERISEFMNTPLGQAISPVSQLVEGAAKAPIETGGFLGALISTAGAGIKNAYNNKTTDFAETFAEKNKRNQGAVGKIIPSTRSANAPESIQFLQDLGNAFGAIEGGVLSTRGLPNLFDKGRKAAAYGNSSELSKLASEAGRTPQSAYLGELSNALKSKSAVQTAEILDNTVKNIAMMGGQTYEANVEKYKSYGFNDEEARSKAMQSTMVNMVGLALPGVIRPHSGSRVKNIMGESGATTLAGRVGAAARQGANFAGDMAALKAVEGAMDNRPLEETFNGGLRDAFKDFLLGGIMNAASGVNGRRSVSEAQRSTIAEAIKDRGQLNSELRNNPEQLSQVNSFLSTIEPYYKRQVESGKPESEAVSIAMEQATLDQSMRKLNTLRQRESETMEPYTAINPETGQPEERVSYLHEDGQWRDTPDPSLQQAITKANNDANIARQSLANIERGTYSPDRVISAREMEELANKKSTGGSIREEQRIPVEVNSPYRNEVIDIEQYRNDPGVQKAMESFGASQLVGDAYVDVTPVIAEDGSIIDGVKGVAAALSRGQTELGAYRSMAKREVDELANDAANESIPTAVDESGLKGVDKTALGEMTQVYADVLQNNFTEDGLPDFAKAMQSVIEDGLQRGYDKKKVLDMANRINANIPESILERYYNDAVKVGVDAAESPLAETEISQSSPESPETEQKEVQYFLQPTRDGKFQSGGKVNSTSDGVYELSISNVNPNIAEIRFVDAPENVNLATQNEESWILSASERSNLPKETTKSIRTDEPGIAELINGEWVIKKKAKITYLDEKEKNEEPKSTPAPDDQVSEPEKNTIQDAPDSWSDKKQDVEIDEIISSTPEISKIGTPKEYSEYVSSVFPDTKVNQILYHGGAEGIERFDKGKLGEFTDAKSAKMGFFFSDNKDISKNYIEEVFIERTGELKEVMDEFNEVKNKLKNDYAESHQEAEMWKRKANRLATMGVDLFKKILNKEYVTASETYKQKLEEADKKYDALFEFQKTKKPDYSKIPDFDENDLWKHHRVTKRFAQGKNLYRVVLNIKDPYVSDFESKDTEEEGFYSSSISEAKRLGKDSSILKNVIDLNKDIMREPTLNKETGEYEYRDAEGRKYNIEDYKGTDYVVFEPEQIHILGSKADVEGFMKWKEGRSGSERETSSPISEQKDVVATKPEVKPESNVTIEPAAGQVEKSVLKRRVYEGDFRKEVKEEIEKFGLHRDVESRKEASANARKLVEDIGADAAFDAIKNRDIEGSAITYVLDAVASDYGKRIRQEENVDERAKLEKRQAEILNELDVISTEAGRQIGALADVYATSDLSYNLGKRIQDYKDKNNGIISAEVEEKFRRLDAELAEVNEKLRLAEERKAELEDQLKRKEPSTYTERSKRIADQFRKLKSKPLTFTAADGTEIVVQKNSIPGIDELIELGAKAIEKTGQIADGVKAIKDELKSKRWFSSLSKEDQDSVMSQIEAHFNIEDEIANERLLKSAKKRTLNSIADLAQRLKDQNFEKKTRRLTIEDNELIQLRAEKERIKNEFDKEKYKNDLKNRTFSEKAKDAAKEAWGITRSLRATGELSFVGLQGLTYTVSHPKKAIEAAKNAVKFMAKEENATEWLNKIKSQEWYPIAKQAKLAITEPSAKDSAREETFVGNWANLLWDKIIGAPTLAMSKSKQEKFRKLNPFKALERGAVGYLDTIRVERFLDGMALLQAKGKNPKDNAKEYKDVADLINTLTGRASIGPLEPIATKLSNIFFSPRMWASQIKTSSPYAVYYFAKLTPTARKMAFRDYGTFVGATAGLVALVAANFNNDDDPATSVEFDPRSSDFGKIKIGNTRIDPWGGHLPEVVFWAREISGMTKDKRGNLKKLGSGPFTPNRRDLAIDRIANKLSPTASILNRYLTQGEKKGKPVDQFGKPYSLGKDVAGGLYPIYHDTIGDLVKDEESSPALDGFLIAYALFGGGVSVQEENKK